MMVSKVIQLKELCEEMSVYVSPLKRSKIPECKKNMSRKIYNIQKIIYSDMLTSLSETILSKVELGAVGAMARVEIIY